MIYRAILALAVLLVWIVRLPKMEIREHLDGDDEKDCWCRPDMVFEFDGRQLWVHHAEGEELPSPKLIAAAIAAVVADRDIKWHE